MSRPGLDFETYSEAGYEWNPATRRWGSLAGSAKSGLEAVGVAVYLAHPTAEVLSLAYDLQDGRSCRLWVPGEPDPTDLFDHIARGGELAAWNAGFEFLTWHLICRPRYGWPDLPLERLVCSMAKARAYGYPGRLAKAAELVGTHLKAKSLGDRVLKRYSIPRNPTAKDARLRIKPSEDGVAAIELYSYNMDDVAAETSVADVVPDLSAEEREVWLLDQRINNRGIPIDLPTVKKAQEIVQYMEAIHNAELRELTMNQVNSYTEVAALQKHLYDYWGLSSASLDEEAIDELLSLHPDMPPTPKRILQIRQAMSSAGVKKVFTMERMANSDNRIRHLYQYHSAHTGRFAAGGIQPHNLKSSGPNMACCNVCQQIFAQCDIDVCRWCGSPDVETGVEWDAKVMLRCLEVWADPRVTPEMVHRMYGKDTLGVLAASVRGMIKAPEGSEFICSDYSAIEAVGLAMLSGEQWRIDVFRTHGKIYEMCASKITGVSFEEYMAYKKQHGRHHPHRKPYGKVPELASGYAGWLRAWKNFGAGEFMGDEGIKRNILAWRAASPMVVELWGGQWRKHPQAWEFTHELYGLEGMAIAAVRNPGYWYTYRDISFFCSGPALFMRLPSGRCIVYHRPQLKESVDRYSQQPIWVLSYEGWNTNPNSGPMGWIRMETRGGPLTNNATQGTCRDAFVAGMLNVEAAHYPVVMHTHDELISEVPVGFGQVEDFERAMMTLPPWCAHWPIKAAGGWRGNRYRKD